MDRKTILEKGLLLGYLLGDLSEEEKTQVEKTLREDEALRAEYLKLESSFQDMSMENAIEPSEKVKNALKEALEAGQEHIEPEIKSLVPKSAYNPTRLMIAASLAAVFALSSFWFYTQWQQAEETLRLAEAEQQSLRESLEQLNVESSELKEVNALLNDRNAIPHLLEGNSLSPDARAVAYINHQKRSVFVNPKALPPLSAEETYQMWADVDGEMINMGLLPTDQDLVFLKYIDRAESLNITIEPRGGSEHPTVDRLISNVYL